MFDFLVKENHILYLNKIVKKNMFQTQKMQLIENGWEMTPNTVASSSCVSNNAFNSATTDVFIAFLH